MHRKLCEAVHFVCKREDGGVLLPNDPDLYEFRPTDKTVATVFVGKNPHKKILPEYFLETYSKTPTLISINAIKDVVEPVTHKLLGSLFPVVREYESLQGWLLEARNY